MLKKKALVLTADQGHMSIALSAIDILTQSGWQCRMVKEDSRFVSPLWEAYNLIYRYAPHLFGTIFELSQKPFLMASYRIYMLFVNAHKVINELLISRPNIIISTHLEYNPFLEVVARTTSIPIINIVSDPHTIHPMIVMPPPAINLVFDQTAANYVKKINSEANVIISGWFVQSKFYLLPSKIVVRKTLRIKRNQFVVTFVTGSTGTNSVLPLIKQLAKQIKNSYLIVVCGNNSRLQKSLQTITTLPTTTLKVIGFTHQVGSLMRAADLVVGKAGPNMLFEAVAVKVPFFASTYITGQESGNIDIIKKYGLGIVQTAPTRAVKQILELQNKPKQLKYFQVNILKMARHNSQCEKVLLKLTAELTKGSVGHHRFKFFEGGGILPRFITANLHQTRKT